QGSAGAPVVRSNETYPFEAGCVVMPGDSDYRRPFPGDDADDIGHGNVAHRGVGGEVVVPHLHSIVCQAHTDVLTCLLEPRRARRTWPELRHVSEVLEGARSIEAAPHWNWRRPVPRKPSPHDCRTDDQDKPMPCPNIP